MLKKKNPRYMHWQIAFRKKGEKSFRLVDNPPYGWAADPFLVKYQGKVLLFAEIFLYKSERNGVIAYCEYDGDGFGKWQISMDEHWHLSYPNVYIKDGNIFMCPESYQKKEIGLYELIELPNKWIQREVLFSNVQCVDTTFLNIDGKEFLFTFEPTFSGNEGKLLMYSKNEIGGYSNRKIVSEDKKLSRPGGNFIRRDGRLYRVGQNCELSYGSGLTICLVEQIEPEYREHVVREITTSDVVLNCKKEILGIHTYNELEDFEVIDVKYYSPSMAEALASRRTRKVFLNKYKV